MRRGLTPIVLCLSIAPAAHAQFVEPDTNAIHTLQGFGTFGWAVSELRDIDGDTIPEAVMGSPNRGGPNTGRVSVHSGATGAEIFHANGIANGEQLGWSIADAGDIDNDGHIDVAAGGNGGFGVVRVFSGNPATLGDEILTISGAAASDLFGYAVSRLDDTNGDGHADLLVGAPGEDPAGVNNAGRAYIRSGADGSVLRTLEGPGTPAAMFGQGVAGVGDLDGDGVWDAVVAAPGAGVAYAFSGASGQRLLPDLAADPTNSNFGQFFVGRVGDVDADDVPDIYIGDFGDAGGVGRCYVFSGADGSTLHNIAGEGPGACFGPGRGMQADINHDGHDDFVVGSYLFSGGAGQGGRFKVFSGRTGLVLRTVTGSAQLRQLGFDVVGLGDVNNDGRWDILASAPNRNFSYVVAGVDPCPADLAEPLGVHDFADAAAFLNAFAAMEEPADLADPLGVLDFSDAIAFMTAFAAGCP